MSTFGQKPRKRDGNQRKRTLWLIVLLIVLVCGAIGCVILIRNNTVPPHSQEFFSAGFSQSIVDSDPDSFIYNVQPGVGINYSDGSSWEESNYEQ